MEPWPHRTELIRREHAVVTIHRINDEAATFLGFTFTVFAVQLTVAAANLVTGHPAGPWYYLLPLLLLSDFLTIVFALAAIARFDLGFEIARIYDPWPTAKEILDQAPSRSDWFPRWWFRLEEAMSKRVPVSEATRLTKFLERIAPFRQVVVILLLAMAVAGTNYFALRGL